MISGLSSTSFEEKILDDIWIFDGTWN